MKEKIKNYITNMKKKFKNRNNSKPMFTTTEVIILMLICILTSTAITSIIYKGNGSSKYVKVDSELQTLISTYNNILDNYYEDVDKQSLIDGAVSGMLEATGDPYSTYMDSNTYNTFNVTLNGSYTGLGIEIATTDNKLIITGIFKDSPASEIGLKLGDEIISIDDKTTDDMEGSDFSQYVKDSEKTMFKLVVKRDEEEITYNIEKKTIVLKSVASKTYTSNDKKIGYIYISIFASNTYEQFKEQLEVLNNENIDSLIIDLRDNSGGELNSASNIISMFLNNDKVMYQMESKTETTKINSFGEKDYDKPIIMLVNSNSASASEVLTAALQENLNATVIGETTYGKGTVQELITLASGEQYKITTKKWLTPKGNWINKTGIKPDVEVELSDSYSQNPVEDNDNQLQTSIKYAGEH